MVHPTKQGRMNKGQKRKSDQIYWVLGKDRKATRSDVGQCRPRLMF